MPMNRLIILVLMLSGLLSCKRNTVTKIEKPAQHYNFKVDFDQSPLLSKVLDKAKSKNKLVYIDIGTKWCLPCQLMKEDVYTDDALGKYMNDNFINYLVDAEKGEGPDLKVMFDIKSYPTLLIVNDRGQVISKKTGAMYHRELRQMAKDALQKI